MVNYDYSKTPTKLHRHIIFDSKKTKTNKIVKLIIDERTYKTKE